jgi:hypothetical protein
MMMDISDLVHIVWIILSVVAYNVVPGFVLCLLSRKKNISLIESFGLAIVLSPVINCLTHVFFGFFGAPRYISLLTVQIVSLMILIPLIKKNTYKLSYDKNELICLLSTALAITFLLSIPGLVNPEVLVRSDNQIHAAVTHSIINTGIPPEAPNLAGYPLLYYWFYDLNTALLSQFTGLHPTSAIYLSNCLGFFSVLVMLWLVSKSFGGRNIMNFMTLIFFSFSLNALKGLELFKEILSGKINLVSLTGVSPILNALTGWGNASIFVGFLVAHAPALSMASIVGGIYCISEFRNTKSREYLFYLLIFLFASVHIHPPTGVYFFLAVSLIAVFQLIFEDGKSAAFIVAVLVISALLALPYYCLLTTGKTSSVWDNYFRTFERGRRLLRSLFLTTSKSSGHSRSLDYWLTGEE